jgi:FixJ family two-component response regulator
MRYQPSVFVVDPDPTTCESIRKLTRLMNLNCETFPSAQEFVNAAWERPGFVILEVGIPDVNGLILMEQIIASDAPMPVSFLTSCSSVSLAVRAMRAGALNFVEKPFQDETMWDSIREGVALAAERCEAWRRKRQIKRQISQLRDRDLEMLELIARGISKRDMAKALEVCVRTVELRRRELLRKLDLESYLDLIHFAVRAVNGNGSGRGVFSQAPEQIV